MGKGNSQNKRFLCNVIAKKANVVLAVLIATGDGSSRKIFTSLYVIKTSSLEFCLDFKCPCFLKKNILKT